MTPASRAAHRDATTHPARAWPAAWSTLCGCLMTLSLLPTAVAQPAQAAQEVIIDPVAFPLAVCNDGTQARYYVRRSPDPAYRKKWLIVFQGGGACYDNASCVERWLDFDGTSPPIGNHGNMTSDGGNGMREFDGKGVLDEDGDPAYALASNPLALFNKIHAHYCSSDSWKGRGGTQVLQGVAPNGELLELPIVFRGADIAEAVVRLVAQGQAGSGGSDPAVPEEIPDDATSEVVLFGQSAGAAGLASQLDDFAGILKGSPAGLDRPRVWGIIDSNEAVGPGMDPRVKDQTAWASSAYWSGRTPVDPRDPASVDRARLNFDLSCLQAHPGYPAFLLCQNTSRLLMAYLETPALIAENAYDGVIHEPFTLSYARGAWVYTGQSTEAIRSAITAGGAWFPARMGVFIPNFSRNEHVLGMNNGTFLASDANSTAPPRMDAPDRNNRLSMASAVGCFRARQNGQTRSTCRFVNRTAP